MVNEQRGIRKNFSKIVDSFPSIQKAWGKVDSNNDGSVDYQEFIKFMNSDTVAEKMGGECIDMPTALFLILILVCWTRFITTN